MFAFSDLVTLFLLAVIVYLLSQVLATQRTQMSADEQFRERDRFENLAMAYFPTLWRDPDLRDDIAVWLRACRSDDERRDQEWHWYTLAQRAKSHEYEATQKPSAEEFDTIIERSQAFLRRCEQGKLTNMEGSFLAYRAWHRHFRQPETLRDHDFASFSEDIDEFEATYLP